jgi:hypothetical protein
MGLTKIKEMPLNNTRVLPGSILRWALKIKEIPLKTSLTVGTALQK